MARDSTRRQLDKIREQIAEIKGCNKVYQFVIAHSEHEEQQLIDHAGDDVELVILRLYEY